MAPTPGILIVLGLVVAAAVLFATRWIPVEMTALGVAVLLAVLEPWTGVTPAEAVSGFASPATLTVLAMFILSEGVRRTGLLSRLARRLATLSRGSERRQVAIAVGLGGPPGAFMNNTPLVSVLVPLLVDLARRNRTSPSRLLLPLSFAAMMGGTLTLLGTSSNLVAADLSRTLLDRPMGIFDITPLGLAVLGAGTLYLMTLGRRRVPARIAPDADLLEKFGLREYLHRLRVGPGSPLVGRTLAEDQRGEVWDLDVLQIRRGRRTFAGPGIDRPIEAGDVLRVRASLATARAWADARRLRMLRPARLTDATLVEAGHTIVELTIAPESDLVGETLVSSGFRNRYDGTALALARGDSLFREQVEDVPLRAGDALLVLLPLGKRDIVDDPPNLVVTRVTPMEDLLRPPEQEKAAGRAWPPVAILAGVVGAAVLGLLPIHIAALGGVVLLVATGSLRPDDAYASVGWEVVFLIAGLIPLGLAMSRTGAGEFLAEMLLPGPGPSPIALLAGFYLATVAVTNVIGNNATVLLMAPIAVDAAATTGAEPFSFLVAVMFAAAGGFLSAVPHPTNLLVYGPGGYRGLDYVRAGALLQVLLAFVTVGGIVVIWGV